MLKKSNMVKERRGTVRVEKCLTVVRCSTKYLFETNSLSQDISEDGICLLTPHRIEIGEILKLGIYLPKFKKPVRVTAKVLRRNETNNPKFPFILGMQFLNITKEAYHQIINHIRYYALKD